MHRITGRVTAAAALAATGSAATSRPAAGVATSSRCHTSELMIRDAGGNGAAGS